MGTYTEKDVRKAFIDMTKIVTVRGRFLAPCVGGQPATREAVEAFVAYQCKIAPGTPEFQAAVDRILKEEIGERDTAPEGGELDTKETYGVNAFRRCPVCKAPVLGNWQVKACLKAAASRLGFFVAKKGTKGDLAEMGEVACLRAEPKCPGRLIHLDGPAVTFSRFQGKVNTPAGAKSIQHDSETLPEGTKFAFSLRIPRVSKLTEKDIVDMIAAAGQIGLGSVRSLQCGTWIAEALDVEDVKAAKE